MFSSPFAYFVFLSWSGFILGLSVVVVSHYLTRWVSIFEKI